MGINFNTSGVPSGAAKSQSQELPGAIRKLGSAAGQLLTGNTIPTGDQPEERTSPVGWLASKCAGDGAKQPKEVGGYSTKAPTSETSGHNVDVIVNDSAIPY